MTEAGVYRRGREGLVDDDTPSGKALSRRTPLRMLIAGTNSSAYALLRTITGAGR